MAAYLNQNIFFNLEQGFFSRNKRFRLSKYEIAGAIIFSAYLLLAAAPNFYAQADTLIVSKESGHGFFSVQSAIDHASAGDTIIIKDGVYRQNLTIDKSLTIRSENGSSKTAICADNNDCPVFAAISSSPSTVTLQGVCVFMEQGFYGGWIKAGPGVKIIIKDICIGWEFDGSVQLVEDYDNDDRDQITDWLPKGLH